jgi:hypothetical protein
METEDETSILLFRLLSFVFSSLKRLTSYQPTLRSDILWQGLNPTVRLTHFRPVGFFEPHTPLVPSLPPFAWRRA